MRDFPDKNLQDLKCIVADSHNSEQLEALAKCGNKSPSGLPNITHLQSSLLHTDAPLW